MASTKLALRPHYGIDNNGKDRVYVEVEFIDQQTVPNVDDDLTNDEEFESNLERMKNVFDEYYHKINTGEISDEEIDEYLFHVAFSDDISETSSSDVYNPKAYVSESYGSDSDSDTEYHGPVSQEFQESMRRNMEFDRYYQTDYSDESNPPSEETTENYVVQNDEEIDEMLYKQSRCFAYK